MSALENAEVAIKENGATAAAKTAENAAEKAADTAAERPRIAVENPATGETIGHVDDLDAAQVAAIVERARAAQPDWEALGFERRAHKLRELRGWLVANRKRVIGTLV